MTATPQHDSVSHHNGQPVGSRGGRRVSDSVTFRFLPAPGVLRVRLTSEGTATSPVSGAVGINAGGDPIANRAPLIKIVGGGLVLLVSTFLFAGGIELVGAVVGAYLLATGVREFRRERQ